MKLNRAKAIAMSFALAISPVGSAGADAPGSYKAGIWVDPDGCQHWVMDLGVEGMMSPVLTKNGKPVCNATSTCAELRGDALFAIDSFVVRPETQATILDLADKLKARGANAIDIVGHTDSMASEAYNMGLSERRAQAVASIIATTGLAVTNVSGKGESSPKASNATKEGRQANRRVEIFCR